MIDADQAFESAGNGKLPIYIYGAQIGQLKIFFCLDTIEWVVANISIVLQAVGVVSGRGGSYKSSN